MKLKYIICILFTAIFFTGTINVVKPQQTDSAVPVTIEAPRKVTFVSEKSYNGHLHPRAEVKVYANIAGKIVKLNAVAGQTVTKGDLLAQSSARQASIDAIKAEVALSVAKSQLTTTEANAQTRVETQLVTAKEAVADAEAKLVETKSLAEIRIRNQLVQARSVLKVANSNYERSKVSSEKGLERAKTEFTKTTSDYERDKELHTQELISDSAYEASETRYKLGKSRYEEAVAAAEQFKDGSAQLSVEKAKAELIVTEKIVESRGWKREIAAAESKIIQAQSNLVTAQKLVEAKSWEREIAIARSAVSEAEEQLKLAREHVNEAIVTSPIDGVVAQRHLEMGEYAKSAASSGQPIFTVVAMDILKAVWTIPVSDINLIKDGNMVLISTSSGIQNIVATIDYISPTVNKGDNTVTVHATLPKSLQMLSKEDPDETTSNMALKPGVSITISIKTGERKGISLVPQRAVLNIQRGKGYIYVVEESVAHVKEVNVRGVYGNEIEVITPLSESMQIIVDNQHLLKNGTPVAVEQE